jgi:hypothetical protein
MDSIIFFILFDRINRIFKIIFPGFPEESLEPPIAFGDRMIGFMYEVFAIRFHFINIGMHFSKIKCTFPAKPDGVSSFSSGK